MCVQKDFWWILVILFSCNNTHTHTQRTHLKTWFILFSFRVLDCSTSHSDFLSTRGHSLSLKKLPWTLTLCDQWGRAAGQPAGNNKPDLISTGVWLRGLLFFSDSSRTFLVCESRFWLEDGSVSMEREVLVKYNKRFHWGRFLKEPQNDWVGTNKNYLKTCRTSDQNQVEHFNQ